MKKPKMYIPVYTYKKYGEKMLSNVTLVNANKIKELEEFIPSEEVLQTHLQIQKIKVQKDENYKPEPLYLTIKKSIFNTIIEKVVFKGGQGVDRERIPLVFQYPALPICIIQPTIED